MVETLPGLENGQVRPIPQDHSQATLAPILKKEDGRMDFARSANDLFNRLRGFQPWPGAFTTFKGKALASAPALNRSQLSDQVNCWRTCRRGDRAWLSVAVKTKHCAGAARASDRRQASHDWRGNSSTATARKLATIWDNNLRWPFLPLAPLAFEILLRVERDESYASELLHSARAREAFLPRSRAGHRTGDGSSPLAVAARSAAGERVLSKIGAT